ncbi:MAG: PAS domain S-box protein [Nitrososphaeria archaeon]
MSLGSIGVGEGFNDPFVKDEVIRALLNLSRDAVIIVDLNGVVVDCNRNALTLLGYNSNEDFIGVNLFNLVSCKGEEKAKAIFAKTLQARTLSEIECAIESKDDRRLIAGMSVEALSLRSGEPAGFLVAIKSIVEGVKDRSKLTEILKRFVEGLQDIFFLYHPREGYLYINPASANVTGYTPDEFYSDKDLLFKIVHVDDLPKKALMVDLIEKKSPSKFDLRIIRKDGEVVWVEGVLLPLLDDEGEVMVIGGMVRDVSEQKQVEEELKRYSKELEQLVKERTEQLRDAEHMAAIGRIAAMVGHDLRNPLQALLNEIYLIRDRCRTAALEVKDQETKKSIEDHFNSINKQVEYMNKIISDLQDYAQPLKPQTVRVNLNRLVHSVLLSANIPNTVSVTVNVPRDLYVDVDPLMMERVFVNLIYNAVQAMPDGGRIMISSSLEGHELFIRVSDTGVGIPKEHMSEIFRPFFTTKPKGHGLGLSVCKRIIEAHKGSISVESKVNSGTTFTIKLPCKQG